MSWIGVFPLLLVGLLGLGVVAACVAGCGCAIAKQRPGLAIALLLGPVGLVLLLGAGWLGLSRSYVRVSQQPSQRHEHPHAGQEHRQAVEHEASRLAEQLAAARRQLDAIQQLGQADGSTSAETNFQTLWQQLTQPQIALTGGADEPASTGADRDGDAPPSDSQVSEQAHRVARLARLLATVATQISDAATTVGREFIPPRDSAVAMAEQDSDDKPAPDADASDDQDRLADNASGGPDAAEASPEPATPAEPTDPAPADSAPEAVASRDHPKPIWIDDPPRRYGPVWREVIATDEYATIEECYRAANIYLLLATYDRLAQVVPQSARTSPSPAAYATGGARPSLAFHGDKVLADGQVILAGRGRPSVPRDDPRFDILDEMGVDIGFLRREVVKNEYLDQVERSFGQMHRLYTQIEFSAGFDRELRTRWASYRRGERLAAVGIGAAGVLGLLTMVFGLLQLDTWTKGYYTKRLFLGVPAAIIGLSVLLLLLNILNS